MQNLKKRLATALTLAGTAAASLVAVFALPGTASATTVNSVRSFDGGVIDAGESRVYTWTNANTDIYQVSPAGVRASDHSVRCAVGVVDQWYRRAAGGVRQFQMRIENFDGVACSVTVRLALLDADRAGSTGTIQPGASKAWTWRNSRFAEKIYLIGVTPNEPASGTCRLDADWRARVLPSGEQRFYWSIRNTGSVACSGTWKLAWLPVQATTTFNDPPLPPGRTGSLSGLVNSDTYRAFVWGLIPIKTGDGNCDWGPRYHGNNGDPEVPTASARWFVAYRNAGGTTCELRTVTRAFID